MNGAGPTSRKPKMIRRQPVAVTTLGISFLSHIQPQQGAVRAYVPPLMTNMRPSTTGDKSNWRRWGSSVACRNPMLTDVTMMLDAANRTPGILRTCSRLAVGRQINLRLLAYNLSAESRCSWKSIFGISNFRDHYFLYKNFRVNDFFRRTETRPRGLRSYFLPLFCYCAHHSQLSQVFITRRWLLFALSNVSTKHWTHFVVPKYFYFVTI
jgi:hypothetical protein